MEAGAIAGMTLVSVLLNTVAPVMLMQGGFSEPGFVKRNAVQIMVLSARAGLELEYESIRYEEGSGAVGIRGLKLRPPAEMGLPGCVIEAGALSVVPRIDAETARFRIEADDVKAMPACAGEGGVMVVGILGPDALNVSHVSGTIEYGLPKSSGHVELFLETASLGAVDAAIELEGLHLRNVEGEPMPAGRVTLVELTLQDVDTLRGILPMFGGPDPAASAAAMLEDALGERADTPDGKALVASAGTEIARVIEDGGALTVRTAPDASVSFEALGATDGPEDLVPLLKPRLSETTTAAATVVPASLLTVALNSPAEMEAEERMRVADALSSGIGAPRAPEAAAALYATLADEGNADAALSYARLQAGTDAGAAYARALAAGADGAKGARITLDEIEAQLPFADALAAQARAAKEYDLPQSVPALRRAARERALGHGAPRSYAEATRLSLLAAAAGDRASLALFERLQARFGDEPAWGELVDAQSGRALEDWAAGLGDTLGAAKGE